jgi:hypothetical protein
MGARENTLARELHKEAGTAARRLGDAVVKAIASITRLMRTLHHACVFFFFYTSNKTLTFRFDFTSGDYSSVK